MNCVRGLPECAGLFVDDVLGIYQFNKVCGGDEIRPVAIPESEISDGGSVCCRNHRVGFIQKVISEFLFRDSFVTCLRFGCRRNGGSVVLPSRRGRALNTHRRA